MENELDFNERFKLAQARRNQVANFVKTTETNREEGENQASDLFKLYNVAVGNSVYIRFFPDPDTNNPVYWRPKAYHRLQFNAIKQPDGTIVPVQKPVTVDVPGWNCKVNEVANNNLSKDYLLLSADDPVQQAIKDLFNGDDTSKELYRKLKVKTQYMMYGIITRYDAHPEFVGKAYRFAVPTQLFDIIRDNLKDEDYSSLPCDLEFGYDFKFTMSKQGEFNDYKSSKFTPQAKAYIVTDEMKTEFEKHHFKPLQEWLLKVPTPEQTNVIAEMTNAVLTNSPFNAVWAKEYMPYSYHLQNGLLVAKQSDNTETVVEKKQETTSPLNSLEALKKAAEKTVVTKAEPVDVVPVSVPTPVVETPAPAPVVETPAPAPVKEAPKTESAIPSGGMSLSDVLAQLGQKK